MITETPTNILSKQEQSQLERIDLAKGAWREGRSGDALILIDSVKSETMTDRVAAECFVNEAVFYAESGDPVRSLKSLTEAAPFMDSASVSAQGTFYNQRARAKRELESFDDALTDYAGAAVLWERLGNREKQGAAALNVAGCYLALGDTEQAQKNLNKAFGLLRNSFYLPQAHDTQAKIFLAEGRLEDAAKSIRVALETVGENEKWRAGFLAVQEQIETRLLSALQVKHLSDWDRLKLNMVRRALQQTGGSTGKAAELLGVTRHSVFSFVETHREELEQYRAPKRVRNKTIVKRF